MGEPTELRMGPDLGVKLFTAEEADALVPRIESLFARIDAKLLRHRELEELLEDFEAYWGPAGERAPERERAQYGKLLGEVETCRAAVDMVISEIQGLGCEVKDVNLGLVDFYTRRDGDLVYLCWKRGEPRLDFWHTLQGGFAARTPLVRTPRAEP